MASLLGEELTEDVVGVLVGRATEAADAVVLDAAGDAAALAFEGAAGVVAMEAVIPMEPLAQSFAEQGVVRVRLFLAGHAWLLWCCGCIGDTGGAGDPSACSRRQGV